MTAEEAKAIVEERHEAFRQYIINNGGDPGNMESFQGLMKTKDRTLELIDQCANDEIMLQRITNMVKEMDDVVPHWKSYMN